jgi:hypothetical protein
MMHLNQSTMVKSDQGPGQACSFTLLVFWFLFACFQDFQAQKQVFYLHGRIVEIQGANAIEKTNGYGAYRYQDILDSLKSKGLQVHSEVRPATTEINAYAGKICAEIKDLIRQGVHPRDITVIGASKGAAIAMVCSELLQNPDIRFVWLAGCCGTVLKSYSGKILSIYEASDACQACPLPDRKTNPLISGFKELELHTGLRHGFLYTPRKEWLEPTLNWIFED